MKIKNVLKKYIELYHKSRGKRIVFIDCGAHVGKKLRKQVSLFPHRDYFAFEPNPDLIPHLHKVKDSYPDTHIEILNKAVWKSDDTIPFYLSKENSYGNIVTDGSTLLQGKTPKHSKSGRIDYDNPIHIKSIDFSSWLKKNFQKCNYIILKMDIEGAEYEVLDKMINDQTIEYINEAFIEFHYSDDDRISSLDKKTHARIVDQLQHKTKLLKWR